MNSLPITLSNKDNNNTDFDIIKLRWSSMEVNPSLLSDGGFESFKTLMVMHQLGGACVEGLEDEEDDVDGGKSCEMNIVEKIYSLLLLRGLEESLVMESASDVQLVGD